MNEIWKSIVGFDGYEVSNLGRVKSFHNGGRILRNCVHAVDTGLRKSGEDNPLSQLTNEQARYVRDNSDNLSTIVLAKAFGVCDTTISDIQRGKIEQRIPGEIREQIRAEYISGVRGHGSTFPARKFGIGKTTVRKILREVIRQ